MVKKLKRKDFLTGDRWKIVLLEINRNSPHSYAESHSMGFNDDNHPIAKNLKITGIELMLAISFLRDNKLIKDNNKSTPLDHPSINTNWSNIILLTEKGFDVAIKLENEIGNQKVQKILVLFTIIIGFTGFITLIKDLLPDKLSIIFWIYLIIIFILLGSYNCNDHIRKIKRFSFNRKIKSRKYRI